MNSFNSRMEEEALKSISGLYRSEDHTLEEIGQRLQELHRPQWQHREIFGEFCPLAIYIDCPLDKTLAYVSRVESLEEWTVSIRKLLPWKNGLYKGIDSLGSTHEWGADIYFKFETNLEAGTVDMFCAWDQSEELWMRYYFRFVDAQPALGKPGSLGFWVNAYHPYYDRSLEDVPSYIKKSRESDTWVGDLWDYFYVGHALEFNNLKLILEHRHLMAQKA